MREDAEKRLATLRSDYQDGTERLLALEQQATSMRETLLRISGAIQILEELLAADTDSNGQRTPEGAQLHVP